MHRYTHCTIYIIHSGISPGALEMRSAIVKFFYNFSYSLLVQLSVLIAKKKSIYRSFRETILERYVRKLSLVVIGRIKKVAYMLGYNGWKSECWNEYWHKVNTSWNTGDMSAQVLQLFIQNYMNLLTLDEDDLYYLDYVLNQKKY